MHDGKTKVASIESVARIKSLKVQVKLRFQVSAPKCLTLGYFNVRVSSETMFIDCYAYDMSIDVYICSQLHVLSSIECHN